MLPTERRASQYTPDVWEEWSWWSASSQPNIQTGKCFQHYNTALYRCCDLHWDWVWLTASSFEDSQESATNHCLVYYGHLAILVILAYIKAFNHFPKDPTHLQPKHHHSTSKNAEELNSVDVFSRVQLESCKPTLEESFVEFFVRKPFYVSKFLPPL